MYNALSKETLSDQIYYGEIYIQHHDATLRLENNTFLIIVLLIPKLLIPILLITFPGQIR